MKVLMLGEGLAKKGGIVSVQQLILEYADSTVEIEHLATLIDGSSTDKLRAFSRAIFDLSRKLLVEDIALVHIHVSERGSAFRQAITTLISKLFGKPVVMHTHGSEFHEFYNHLPVFLRAILSWAYRKCDRFIVLSEGWKQYYTEALGLNEAKTIVLPNAVRLPDQVPDRTCANQRQILLVFFGRIGQRKGAFDLARAIALLPEEYRARLKVVIAGDGEVSHLKALVNDLELADVISVKDWISPEQRETLSREASIFALPSYNEGLPMALLEAMSWGLAVITTPVGGIPALIKHKETGLLVEPGDLTQIADSIQLLIDNEALRASLGDAARTEVLPFGSQQYWRSLKGIYESVR